MDWYNVFSKPEFEALGLVSNTYEVFLEGLGNKDILVTKGNTIAVQFEDEFLPLEFADRNPYQRGDYAVYVDEDENVWVGIEEDT